jgi:hypothetical protein
VVEVDEAFITPKKGGRGRRMRRLNWWLFGAVEGGTNRSFLGLCRRRTDAVLTTMIRRHIFINTFFVIQMPPFCS